MPQVQQDDNQLDQFLTKFATALEKRAEAGVLDFVGKLPPELTGALLGGAAGAGMGFLRPKKTRRLGSDALMGSLIGAGLGLGYRQGSGLSDIQKKQTELGASLRKVKKDLQTQLPGVDPNVVVPEAAREGFADVSKYQEQVPGSLLQLTGNVLFPGLGGVFGAASSFLGRRPAGNLGLFGKPLMAKTFNTQIKALENLIPKSILEHYAIKDVSKPISELSGDLDPTKLDVLKEPIEYYSTNSKLNPNDAISLEKRIDFKIDPKNPNKILNSIQKGLREYFKKLPSTSTSTTIVPPNIENLNNQSEILRNYAEAMVGQHGQNYVNALAEAMETNLVNGGKLSPKMIHNIFAKHNALGQSFNLDLPGIVADSVEHLNTIVNKARVPNIQTNSAPPITTKTFLGNPIRSGQGAVWRGIGGAGLGALLGAGLQYTGGSQFDKAKTEGEKIVEEATNAGFDQLKKMQTGNK
jgi:hypothetical protein